MSSCKLLLTRILDSSCFGGLREGLRKGREGSLTAVGNYCCYENTQTWWTTKDGQGYHHLPSTTAVPWGGTQPKVTIKPRHHTYTIMSLTSASR